MKILVICTVDLDKNGISTCIMNYFELIASSEIQMDLVAPNIVSEELRKTIESKGMKLYELPMRKESTLSYFLKLRKIISRGSYDVVHAHGNSCTLAIELLAARLGGCRRRIAHSHNTTCEHKRAHKLLRPVFELCCTERFACGEAAGKWLFQKKKFDIIKNGVNLDIYNVNEEKRKKLRCSLGVLEDEILIGHIGVFNYQKNHEFLVEVFKELKENNQEKFKMVLIGDGSLKTEIEGKVKEYALEKDIFFTGNISDVADYLQAIDILLLPSRFEGLPYVLVEAQAAGKLCIVSDKVSVEARLTELVHFVSIDSSSEWVENVLSKYKIYKNMECKKQIQEAHNELTKKGYSLIQNAKYLKDRYLKIM